VQTLSGTGANHLGALFLSKFYQWRGEPTVGLSNPTWGERTSFLHSHLTSLSSWRFRSPPYPPANHHAIFRNVGITPIDYPYYDARTISLAFEPLLAHLRAAPHASVFLLHACAHNPTGVDPTREQWAQVADAMLDRGHYAFFDCAYQGFASGDLEGDAWAVSLVLCAQRN
jgi:aspartate aminotransferase